jgi:hypothetical protein
MIFDEQLADLAARQRHEGRSRRMLPVLPLGNGGAAGEHEVRA